MKAVLVFYNEEDGNIIENGIYNEVIDQYEARGVVTVAGVEIPRHRLIDCIGLCVSGKTYQERKANLEDKAILWSHAGSVAPWSYGELADIQGFFETNGKRYGLLKEFRENAII